MALAGAALVLTPAAAGTASTPSASGAGTASPGETSSTGAAHLGAVALHDGAQWGEPREDWRAALTPDGPNIPANPGTDRPQHYADGCHADQDTVEVLEGCVYGDPDGDLDVFVVGSSKSGTYVGPLDTIGRREGWAVRAMTRSATQYTPGVGSGPGRQFNDNVLAEIAAEQPEVVALVADRSAWFDYSGEDFENIVADTLAAGAGHVLLLWNSPTTEVNELDAQAIAMAAQHDDISYVTVEDWVCPDGASCPAHIGGVTVNGNGSHLTATYGSSLTNPLHARLHEAGLTDTHPDQVDRIQGANRYATAAHLAQHDSTGATRTYVTSGEEPWDALAAGAQAGGADRLVLTHQDRLTRVTQEALRDLGGAGHEVVIVGGESAVSAAVETALEDLGVGDVTRVAGKHRYETAVELVQGTPDRVYLTNGRDYPDGLAVGGVSAPGADALLLTRPHALPSVTRAALTDLAPAEVVIVGGESAVDAAVRTEIEALLPDADVTRVAGPHRYATAAALVEQFGGGDHAYVATGTAFSDALAAGQLDGPVLLTRPGSLPQATAAALTDVASLGRTTALGGQAAVQETVLDQVRELLR